MGYTHYYTANLNQENFDKVANDVKKIEGAVELFDGIGETKGVRYEDSKLYFNGNNAEGDSHETLELAVGDEWEFCKTARKPYDVAVVAALLCLKFHNTKADISSDGDLEDWEDGIELFKELFPSREVAFGFDGEGRLIIEDSLVIKN